MDSTDRGRWLAEREGKLTASRMADAMSFRKDKKPAAARTDYMRELCAERAVGGSVRHFVTPAMQHGLDYEEEAWFAYEAHTGIMLDAPPQPFFDHPTIPYCGASPDRFCGPDGLAETKCPTTAVFMEWVLAGVVPEEHKPQMILQLDVTGRKWCEFIAYDPRIKVPARRLFIRRYVPTPEEIGAVRAAARQFLEEVDVMFELFTQAA